MAPGQPQQSLCRHQEIHFFRNFHRHDDRLLDAIAIHPAKQLSRLEARILHDKPSQMNVGINHFRGNSAGKRLAIVNEVTGCTFQVSDWVLLKGYCKAVRFKSCPKAPPSKRYPLHGPRNL